MRLQGALCPMGCGETLEVRDGHVSCTAVGCPRADAAHEILTIARQEHVVYLQQDGRFAITHPLHERLEDALAECPLHRAIGAGRVSEAPGVYLVEHRQGVPEPEERRHPLAAWRFVRIDEAG